LAADAQCRNRERLVPLARGQCGVTARLAEAVGCGTVIFGPRKGFDNAAYHRMRQAQFDLAVDDVAVVGRRET